MSESALDRERRDHARTKDENQRHIQELQKRLQLESQFRTTSINDLLRTYPSVKRLFEVLHQEIAATHPLRGVPSEDTMRVGHPELNAVESAANQGPSSRSKRWDGRILRLAEQLDDELAGSESKRPGVEKPRCRRRDCSEPDKRQPFGAKYCAFCARPMGEAA
jgi:hypothetical protein